MCSYVGRRPSFPPESSLTFRARGMKIGELPARTGVPRRLLRYYEQQQHFFGIHDGRIAWA